MTRSIYKDELETSREIWVETEGHALTMLLQDLGPACRMISGDDEYEREVSCRLEDLKAALGANTENEVLEALAHMFRTADAIDRFEEYLEQHSIKFTSYSC